MSMTNVRDGVMLFAEDNSVDSVYEWLNDLVWDETPRVETFLIDVFGAADNEYTRAASKNMWISLAARIATPGCKVDNMVILEGLQGKGKSTVLDIIGGDYFSENSEDIAGKDFAEKLRGKLVVEFAELDYFRKSDIETLKRVISCRIDRFRPSYGRREHAYPRRCIFIGTTNKDEYLHDETGARRFWPIACSKADPAQVRKFRDQYFAEAYDLFVAGETWWEMPKEATARAQELRSDSDPRTPDVIRWLADKATGNFTLIDIARALRIADGGKLLPADRIQLGKILSKLNCKKVRTNTTNVYTIPKNIQQIADELDRAIYGYVNEAAYAETLTSKEKPLRSKSEGLFSGVTDDIPF